MVGFRSLGDDEEVEFECKISDKGLEATSVTGVEGSQCKGSHRRPMPRRRFKKVRCYNCGEFANHIAAKCNMGPQPKKCHQCKSIDHLIADCPLRDELKLSDELRQGKTLTDDDDDDLNCTKLSNEMTSEIGSEECESCHNETGENLSSACSVKTDSGINDHEKSGSISGDDTKSEISATSSDCGNDLKND